MVHHRFSNVCSLVGILEQFGGSEFCFLDHLLSGEVAFLSNGRASHYLDLVIVEVVFSFSLLPRISKECCSNPCSMDFDLSKLLQLLCREKYVVVFELPSVFVSDFIQYCPSAISVLHAA